MRSILITALFLIPLFLFGQMEGEVLYREAMKLDIDIPDEMKELMKDMPTSRTTIKSLIFKGNKSLYQNVDNDDLTIENRAEDGNGENVIRMEIRQPDNKVFSDFTSSRVTQKQDLMGKEFIIEDDLREFDWKVTSERSKILDHVCMRATTEVDDETSVEAWFATDIPLSSGPQDFNGLPGLILMLDINDGQRIVMAKEINLGSIEDARLIIPKKGKKVNRATYEEIEAKKMEEMNAINGGSGMRIIVREEH